LAREMLMLCAMLQYAVARGIDPRVHRHQAPRHGISIETVPLISDIRRRFYRLLWRAQGPF